MGTSHDAPDELDLFKAEIFGEDSSNEEDISLSFAEGSTHNNNNNSSNHNDSHNDSGVDAEGSETKQKQANALENDGNNNNGVVVIVTSAPPTETDDDVAIYDNESGSSADTSRRSSCASGGDVTPQIESLGMSSALSRVSVGGTSPEQCKSPVALHRINVTPRGSIVCDKLPLTSSADDVIDTDIRSSLWQPMKPGYMPTNVAAANMMGQQLSGTLGSTGAGGPSVVIQRTVAVQRNISTSEQESNFRLAIPVMPKYLAVITAIMNVLCPGLGTFVSGLSILFGSEPRQRNMDKTHVIWTNMWVAFLQLVTTPLLLLGWIWSIVWSTAFISISKTYYRKSGHRIIVRTASSESTASTQSTGNSRGGRRTMETTTTTTTLSIQQPETPPIIVVNDGSRRSATGRRISVQPVPVAVTGSSHSPVDRRYSDNGMMTYSSGYQNTDPYQHHHRPSNQGSGGGDPNPSSAGSSRVLLVSDPHRRPNRQRQHQTRRPSVRSNGSSHIAPEVLLAPGALETIVIHNGAFYVTGTTRSGHVTTTSPMLMRQPSNSSSGDQDFQQIAGKSETRYDNGN